MFFVFRYVVFISASIGFWSRVCYWFLLFSLLSCAIVQSQQGSISETTATLSEARCYLAATSSGALVFFGGGYNATGPSNRVDICNVTSGIWTTATLSIPRAWLAAVSSGSLVFFAGGWNATAYSNQVDIYNTANGSWNSATLSQARCCLAATSVGSLVLFAGGFIFGPSNVVDIYNVANNTWMTATLSQARGYLAATSVANQYAFFAGGWNGSNVSNVVDIFYLLNGTWSTTTLSQARQLIAATSLGNLAFFGGGVTNIFGNQTSNIVDIFNSTIQTWSTATLSQARYGLVATSIGDIIAFGGGFNGSTFLSVVDMYNMTNSLWFTTTLSQPRAYLAATSSTNKLFFGGGQNGSGYSDIVDIFQIPSSPLIPSTSTTPIPNPSNSTLSSPINTPTLSSNYPSVTNIQTSLPSNTLNSPQPNSTHVGTSGLSSGAIIGIVVGIVLLLIALGIVLFLILFIKRRKQKHQQYDQHISTTQHQSETVVIESVSKTVHDETNTTATLSTYQPGTKTLIELSPGQISLNELEIGKEIGEGTYGRVYVGKWKKYRVALKFCQNRGKMEEFMREANLMISLPPHRNVVRMYGVSIDGTQPIIVMEYCGGGSLDKVLHDKDHYIANEQKICWVHEIALGMRHLHKYNIVHRDLAARNILLSHSNLNDTHLKISDFGMSRVLQEDSASKTRTGIGPVCWMAPESLREKIYSKKSDVWMFGILVYEIVSRCEPHYDKDPMRVSSLIRDEGVTPNIPNDCPHKLRQLMIICWNKQPEQRPSFETICEILVQ